MAHELTRFKWLVVAGAILLHGCGGGEYAGIDRGGEKPDLSVTGPINGFGSVIVNGVHYNTDDAAIYVRGVPADEQQLDVGDYVTVVGRINDEGEGIAHEVHYQPKVTGAIEWLDPMRNRISVLGQVVQLVQDTHYGSSIRPRNIEGLAEGQLISVSGIAAADRVIRASRVELETQATAEVAGMVASLDPVEQSFYLNELRVEYAFATPQPTLSEGQPVVVRGVLDEQTFRAHSISFATDYRNLSGITSLEFRGYVTDLHHGQFQIDGVPAELTSATSFANGIAADLAENSQVRARGHFDERHVLQVEHLEYINSPVMMSYGIVEAIGIADPGSAYVGAVTISGFTYRLKPETSLVGDFEQRISFNDLRVGDAAYVSAFSEDQSLVAASLVIDNRDTYTMSFQFEGGAHSIDHLARQFSIFGRRIQTTEETIYSEEATPLTAEGFYLSLKDKSVRVRGKLENGVLIASRAQVSNDSFFDGFGDGFSPVHFGSPAFGGEDCAEDKDKQEHGDLPSADAQ